MDRSKEGVSVILLAGGKGSRLGAALPKQFLRIKEKEIALYSFEMFLSISQVSEIVVVAPKSYWPLFQSNQKKLSFALPGLRRQDSSYHGFLKTSFDMPHVCIHDAARPCLDKSLLLELFRAAKTYGAAALGVQSTATLKEADESDMILKTIDRAKVWMIQTPQVLRRDWLLEGFAYALKHQLQVTDDLQLIEPLGYPAKIIKSTPNNLKLTHPEDLRVIHSLLEQKGGA